MTSLDPDGRETDAPTVGRYRLVSRIGEGGMGVVHLAEDPQGRRVALKVLRPHVVGDDEGRQRLAQEVASLGQVRSPHVAEVLDADPWGETPYVVVRHVPGASLREVVRRDGPLTPEQVGRVARTLLAAVRDVHHAGVVHRDIKPTNVMLEDGSPVLIDFGLARLAEDPRLTATGLLLGTPGYLAPEVLAGDPATTATDIHGWAATLVYAAAGHPPYGTGHTMGVLDRTRRGEVDLTGVPEGLRPLLAACLAVDPRHRPSADAVERGLSSWVATGVAVVPPRASAPPAPASTPPAPAPTPPADPTRSYTVVAPAQPPVVAPTPGAPGPPVAPPAQALPAWPSGWATVRHTLTVAGVLASVAAGFRLAPYLTFAVLAVSVLLLRGLSRAGDSAMMRRWSRGPRWYDVPQTVLGYPWHLLTGSVGSLVLLVVAGLSAATLVATLEVLGLDTAMTLLAGGALLALLTWWGPGSRRVRRSMDRTVGRLARRPMLGWAVPAGVWLGVVALVLAHAQGGVVWAPADSSPWEQAREVLDSFRLPGSVGS